MSVAALANTVVAVGWGGTIVRTMALKRVPSDVADQVKLVFVTADPARDTAVALRRWLDSFDKRFVGLTGTEAALKAAQRATGVSLARKIAPLNRSYSVAHANLVVAYTRDNLAHAIHPGGVSKDDWMSGTRCAIRASGAR